MFNSVFRRYFLRLRAFVYRFLLRFVEHRTFSFFSTVFLVGIFGWRLLFSYGSFAYARRSLYNDLYFFHLIGFVKDFLSIFRWTRLGDFAEALRILGPTRVIGFLSRPARKLEQLESAWYWKSNPAMWLPDKMWNDIVDAFDRKYFSRVKWVVKVLKREVEGFADSPYSRLRVYAAYVFTQLTKLKFPRFRRPRFLKQFFNDLRSRFLAIVASRSMLIYHGLGRNAVLYGKVPAFMLSPVTFDFSKKKLIFKDTAISSGPLNTDKLIEDEILNKLLDYPVDSDLFSKPNMDLISDGVQQKRYKRLIKAIYK